MKLSLRVSAKWLDFLDGLTELNANDVMWQWLEVYLDTPLATRQSLWVTYTHKKYGEHTHEILFAEDGVGRVAKSHIPPEVIKIAGEWTLQIFIRQYSITDTSKYTQAGTNKVTFTVADGLPLDAADAPVNNETIASLYEKAKEIIKGGGGNGTPGVGISNVYVENGELKVELTNGIVINAGQVQGEPGAPGEPCAPGEDYILTEKDIQDIAREAAPLVDVSTPISTHNVNTVAHNDIRLLIQDLANRLNALANSDDETLDQLSEIVTYIKANKGLIDGVTTSKVNITDIVANLTTNVDDKPLSASQGVILNELISDTRNDFDDLSNKISNIEVDETQNRIAVFLNITTPNTTVTFKNLKGLYKIVWDAWGLDENADSKPYEVLVDKETTEYSHTYERALEGGNEYWVYLYGVTEIGYQAFKNIKFLTNIYLGNRVTLIGNEAFQGCTGLKDLSVPNSVQSIGVSAFHGCTGITEVILNFGLVTIYDLAFGACENMAYINIPYSVTSIGERAFAACYALTDIIIPDSVVTIGQRLFMNCTSLKTVRIGKCVKEIGYAMFDNVPLEVLFLEPINPPKIDFPSYPLEIPTAANIVVSYGFGDNYKKDEYWSRYESQIYSEVLYQGADGYIYQKE